LAYTNYPGDNQNALQLADIPEKMTRDLVFDLLCLLLTLGAAMYAGRLAGN